MEIIQIEGPCKGQTFIVLEREGSMLKVQLKGKHSHPEWSHKDYYRDLNGSVL